MLARDTRTVDPPSDGAYMYVGPCIRLGRDNEHADEIDNITQTGTQWLHDRTNQHLQAKLEPGGPSEGQPLEGIVKLRRTAPHAGFANLAIANFCIPPIGRGSQPSHGPTVREDIEVCVGADVGVSRPLLALSPSRFCLGTGPPETRLCSARGGSFPNYYMQPGNLHTSKRLSSQTTNRARSADAARGCVGDAAKSLLP